MLRIITEIVLCLCIFMFALIIISNNSKSKLFCKILGWHKAPTKQGFDGCSKNGECPRCGKEVMQDSQGNWF